MKFRPQVQLRFRSSEQHEAVKRAASGDSVSVNEYLVRLVDEAVGTVKLNKSASLTGFDSQRGRGRKTSTFESDGSSLAGEVKSGQLSTQETRKRVRKGEAGSRKGQTFPDETQAGTQDNAGQLAARGEGKATASGPVASSPFKVPAGTFQHAPGCPCSICRGKAK